MTVPVAANSDSTATKRPDTVCDGRLAAPPGRAVASTVELTAASQSTWDVAVVGCGPTGALAGYLLAQAGKQVLLIDKASFPRAKVCGGCLGSAALAVLDDVGLQSLTAELGAQPTDRLIVRSGKLAATLPLPGGVAVSREVLDAALIRAAVAAGCQLLDGTTARLDQRADGSTAKTRSLRLQTAGEEATVACRLVVAADGLAGALLGGCPGLPSEIATGSRIGVGAVIERCELDMPGNVVTMIYAPGGYLGMVRVEGKRLNLAAALDAAYVRDCGGPASAVERHLESVGWGGRLPRSHSAWQGTPALTRRRPRLWEPRLLVAGDAAGYIEPFTGEGMTWAMMAARLIVEPALAAVDDWTPAVGQNWQRRYRRLLGRRQWLCRAVTALLRRPWATRLAIQSLARYPWLARPALGELARPLRVA